VSILQSIELSFLKKIDVVRRLGDRRLGNSNERVLGSKRLRVDRRLHLSIVVDDRSRSS
jgi:hypothetical protein